MEYKIEYQNIGDHRKIIRDKIEWMNKKKFAKEWNK